MTEPNEHSQKLASFRDYREIFFIEQTLFWNRFVAFTAIAAGLFAIYPDEGSSPLAILGTSIAALWVFVQFRSRRDVSRWRTQWSVTRRAAGVFESPDEEREYAKLGEGVHFQAKKLRFNNLEAGCAAATLALLAWLGVLFGFI